MMNYQIGLSLKILSLSLLLSGQNALATDTENGTVEVTVNASITIDEITQMNFGSFFMTGNVQSGGETEGGGAIGIVRQENDSAWLQLNWDGTVTPNDGTTAKAAVLAGGSSVGVFNISLAAFNTTVKISATEVLDVDSTAGVQPVTGPGPNLHVLNFTDLEIDTDGLDTAQNDITDVDGDSQTVVGTTDGGGLLTIRTIGRLYSTDLTADNLPYDTGAYLGGYTLNISY